MAKQNDLEERLFLATMIFLCFLLVGIIFFGLFLLPLTWAWGSSVRMSAFLFGWISAFIGWKIAWSWAKDWQGKS